MKRILIALLAIALIIPSSLAWSAVKAGDKCSKVGKKEVVKKIQYICTKKNGKLVWSKSDTGLYGGYFEPGSSSTPTPTPTPLTSPTPTPTPTASPTNSATPSPTPTPTPTPTPLSDIERWDATGSKAMSVFRKWGTSKAGEKPKTKIEFNFGPNFWKEVEDSLRPRFESVVAYFDRYTDIQIPIYFMVGTKDDLDWICRLLESKDSTRRYQYCVEDESKALKNEEFGPARGFDLKNGSANFYLFRYKETEDMQGFKPRIEHEYFHSVQQNILRNKFRTNIPCWFLEGGPEYFGMLTFSHGNAEDFLKLRRQSILGAPERRPENVTAADLTTWLTNASVPWQDSQDAWGDNCAPYKLNGMYHDGALATEWLVDRIGVDGIMTLMKDAADTSWDAAFEKNTKVTVKEGYRLIGEYMLKERNIAKENSWMSPVRCISSTGLPGPIKNPPGCWF